MFLSFIWSPYLHSVWNYCDSPTCCVQYNSLPTQSSLTKKIFDPRDLDKILDENLPRLNRAKILPRFSCRILPRENLGSILAGILPRSRQDEFLSRILARILVKNLGKNSCQESWHELLPRSWWEFLNFKVHKEEKLNCQKQQLLNSLQFLKILVWNSCWDLAKILDKHSCKDSWQEFWHEFLLRSHHRFLPRFLPKSCQDSWVCSNFCEGLAALSFSSYISTPPITQWRTESPAGPATTGGPRDRRGPPGACQEEVVAVTPWPGAQTSCCGGEGSKIVATLLP